MHPQIEYHSMHKKHYTMMTYALLGNTTKKKKKKKKKTIFLISINITGTKTFSYNHGQLQK